LILSLKKTIFVVEQIYFHYYYLYSGIVIHTKKMKNLIILIICTAHFGHLFSQTQPSPVLFIYDASGSMWGKIDNKTKKEIASTVLISTVEALPGDQNIGLMVYGHRQKDDCNDIEIMVDLSKG